MDYLRDAHETIQILTRQQLEVLERSVYVERLTTGAGLLPEASHPLASCWGN
jgi:hypothetical protein